jgi:hypothetical protein
LSIPLALPKNVEKKDEKNDGSNNYQSTNNAKKQTMKSQIHSTFIFFRRTLEYCRGKKMSLDADGKYQNELILAPILS